MKRFKEWAAASGEVKIVSLAASALLLGSMALAGPAVAAADSPAGTARACTAGAPQFTSYAGTGSNDPAYWPARGTYATTTTRRVDINVKLNSTRRVQTCFKKGKGWSCNGFRTLTGGRWGLAAKNVLDGTKFFLQFEGTARASGQLDY
ncbi:hypothetical protein ACH4C2_30650 [Streptomyces sp. NPDC018057]|uniref:hypothetical protein n=1 Tax=unclassified Streptomyces TaxID=2593676 RepID=UPI0037AC7206